MPYKDKERNKAYYESHKEQKKAYYEAYRESHKEQKKAYYKAYYESHKEQFKAYRESYKEQRKAYYESHKERSIAQSLARYAKMVKIYNREKLIKLLGNKCSICGIDDIIVLQLDHIYGGGNKDLISLKNTRYEYYIMHIEEAKAKLQVLCANCHLRKHAAILIPIRKPY